MVYLAKEDLIKDYSCGCMAFGQQEGLCRHLVAMLMEFNYKAEDGELDQYDDQEPIFEKSYEIPLKQVPKEPAKPSDQELKKLVDYYVLCDRNQFCQEYGNGNIRLEPTLHLEMERESLELKIGTTQLYVIKDIAQLIDDIKQMRYVTYGKKLAFTHTQSAFTRESSGIVNLLLELDNENEYSYRYRGWGYGSTQQRRSVTLSPIMLDQLLELYEGKELQVNDHILRKESKVFVLRKNPRLPLKIKGNTKGADVEMEPVCLIEGSRYWHLFSYLYTGIL